MTTANGTLGARIRARRTALDLTPAEFGSRADLTVQEVCDLEKGRRGGKSGIGSAVLSRIADALDCSADWLLGRDRSENGTARQRATLRQDRRGAPKARRAQRRAS